MRAYPIGQTVVNRAYLQIDGLDRTKGALDVGERLVIAHTVGDIHLRGAHRGTNDVDAVERGFGSDALVFALEGKRVLTDVEYEMLSDLVLVDDFTHLHPDLVLAGKICGRHLGFDLRQIDLGCC